MSNLKDNLIEDFAFPKVTISSEEKGSYHIHVSENMERSLFMKLIAYKNPLTDKDLLKYDVASGTIRTFVQSSLKNNNLIHVVAEDFRKMGLTVDLNIYNHVNNEIKKATKTEKARKELTKQDEDNNTNIYNLALKKELSAYDEDEIDKLATTLNTVSKETLLSKPLEKFLKVSKDDGKMYMYITRSGLYEEFSESVIKRIIEDDFNVKNVTPNLIYNVKRMLEIESGNYEYQFKFNKNYVAMKFGNINKFIWLHLKHERHNGQWIFRVYAKSISHMCKTFYEGYLDPNQVKCMDDDNFEFSIDEYNNINELEIVKYFKDNVIYYSPRNIMEEQYNNTLLQYFLKTSIVNDESIEHIRNHCGQFFYNGKIQKVPFLTDLGRTGKSEFVKTVAHMHHVGARAFDLTNNYTFANEQLLGATFLYNNEMQSGEGKVSENKFKEISGSDMICIFRKQKNPLNTSAEGIYMWVVSNKIFPATDSGDSMVKRIDFIMFEKKNDIVIEGISNKIIYGYDIDQDGLRFKNDNGDYTLFLEWMMLGTLEILKTNGRCLTTDIPAYCKALNAQYFKKMMRVRDFLDEVEIVPDDSGLYEVCDEVKELYNNFHENLGIDKKFIKSNIIDDIINTVNSKEKEKAREEKREPITVYKTRKLIKMKDGTQKKVYIANIRIKNICDEIDYTMRLMNETRYLPEFDKARNDIKKQEKN